MIYYICIRKHNLCKDVWLSHKQWQMYWSMLASWLIEDNANETESTVAQKAKDHNLEQASW